MINCEKITNMIFDDDNFRKEVMEQVSNADLGLEIDSENSNGDDEFDVEEIQFVDWEDMVVDSSSTISIEGELDGILNASLTVILERVVFKAVKTEIIVEEGEMLFPSEEAREDIMGASGYSPDELDRMASSEVVQEELYNSKPIDLRVEVNITCNRGELSELEVIDVEEC